MAACSRLGSRPTKPEARVGTPEPLLLAPGGIHEGVLHVVNLAAEVFTPGVLLLLELIEQQPLLLQSLCHPGTVSVQTLLMKQDFSCKKDEGNEVLWDPESPQDIPLLDRRLPLPGQLQSRDRSGQYPLPCPTVLTRACHRNGHRSQGGQSETAPGSLTGEEALPNCGWGGLCGWRHPTCR